MSVYTYDDVFIDLKISFHTLILLLLLIFHFISTAYKLYLNYTLEVFGSMVDRIFYL